MAIVNSNYLLAIESAIAGGSIALFKDENFVSGASGERTVSRAEDLLPRLIDLLFEAGVERTQISRIAVSLGPGSYTGLRIGIATVMGLCRGLEIPYVGVAVFDAIANAYQERRSLIALPMGRSDICISEYGSESSRVTSLENLKLELDQTNHSKVFAHSALVPDLIQVCPNVVDVGTNLARFIGAAACLRAPSTLLEPIYIQNPRFS